MSERDAILTRIRDALRVTAPQPGTHDHRPLTSARNAAAAARQWLPATGDSHEDWLALFARNSAELKTQFLIAPDPAGAHALLAQLAASERWQGIAAHDGTLTNAAAATTGLPVMTTLITGPSRTGDIERILVLGAHGPKKLTVILISTT